MKNLTGKTSMAGLLAGIITVFASSSLFAQTPSNSDLWDISQGNVVTFNSPLYSGSDIRDMFGGQFSSVNTGYTVFQDEPVGTVNAVEWQTPYYAQITNFDLFLSPDPAGARDVGSVNLYAYNGASFQLIYSSNAIPTYSSPIIISGQLPATTANRWRAEFTTASSGPNNGPRVDELDGFGTIVPPLNIPSDGSDGSLNITNNTVIDLSQASYSSWNQNNSTNAGNGVYDPSKWAVVFKYSSVNIASGATATFLNHPSHAPVVWLVQSNVVINGSLKLDGTIRECGSYPDYLLPVEPGPGGFRGSASSTSGQSDGYGPAGGGSPYASPATYLGSYGNPQIVPLIGGSGSGGNSDPSLAYCDYTVGGGGAILIAAAVSVTIDGTITAHASTSGYEGADGAVRIISDVVLGSGTIDVSGTTRVGPSTVGRTRVECNTISSQLKIFPNTVAVPPGSTPVLWPSSTAPTVSIVSVSSINAPTDPVAAVTTTSDVSVSTNGIVSVLLQTQNFPPSGIVLLRVTPKYSGHFNVNAVYQSGTFSNAVWTATTTLPDGFCVLQAHATSP